MGKSRLQQAQGKYHGPDHFHLDFFFGKFAQKKTGESKQSRSITSARVASAYGENQFERTKYKSRGDDMRLT
jgi:hypothetical protein